MTITKIAQNIILQGQSHTFLVIAYFAAALGIIRRRTSVLISETSIIFRSLAPA